MTNIDTPVRARPVRPGEEPAFILPIAVRQARAGDADVYPLEYAGEETPRRRRSPQDAPTNHWSRHLVTVLLVALVMLLFFGAQWGWFENYNFDPSSWFQDTSCRSWHFEGFRPDQMPKYHWDC